jgi:hypothetical protein
MTRELARFTAADGVQWIVTRIPAVRAGAVRVEFMSDTGERRSCEVVPIADESWRDLPVDALQSLMRVARP